MKRLVISDLHFGSAGAVAVLPLALERLEPELEWADELVICGDLFALMFADWKAAVDPARPFFELVASKVKSVVFVPGNHDHHFVLYGADKRRREEVFGGASSDPARLEYAEEFLGKLMPGISVHAAYPFVELDGVSYIHGHQFSALLLETGVQWIDRWLWRWQVSHPRHLKASDYEALQAPFFELAYLTRSLHRHLPKDGEGIAGRRLQSLFSWSYAAIASNGGNWQTWLTLCGRELARKRGWRPSVKTHDVVVEMMAQACSDLGVASGPVVYAHTHDAHNGLRARLHPEYLLFNSGAWHLNEDLILRGGVLSPPGIVLRVENGGVERRELFSDLTHRELLALLPRWDPSS